MKENYKKLIESEKILRLGDKDNLLSKILCLEKEFKSIKENIKDYKKNWKTSKVVLMIIN